MTADWAPGVGWLVGLEDGVGDDVGDAVAVGVLVVAVGLGPGGCVLVEHGHGKDSQAIPSPSESSWCGSDLGPPAARKKACAEAWVEKSEQSRSPELPRSEPALATATGIEMPIATTATTEITVSRTLFMSAT
jgi:hypothetical protein